MRVHRVAAVTGGVALAAVLLGACSSSETASMPASAIAAASSAAAAAGGNAGDMAALCAQMVDQSMDADAATALAESQGYIARVGSIDGEPQAVTMDFREDRFTFTVENDAVTACTYD